MNPSENNSEHKDSLDELLRQFMLYNDPDNEEGESLLDLVGEGVFSMPLTVTPSSARKAAMIGLLKQHFSAEFYGPAQGATVNSGFSVLRWGLLSFGFLAITTVFLLLSGVFSDPDLVFNEELKYIASPDLNTLANAKGIQPRGEVYVDSDGILNLHSVDSTSRPSHNDNRLGKPNKGDGQRFSGIQKTIPQIDPNPKLYPIAPSPNPPHVIPANLEESTAPDPFPLRGLYAQTSNPSEYFQVDADKDHLIVGKKGTLLHIPKDAFTGELGEVVSGPVQVEVKEVYDKSDYVKSNLSTISNGKQLISGGGLYMDATSAGRRLKLAKGKEIYVEFASQRNADTRGMTLYHGERDETGAINWQPIGGESELMIPLPLDEMFYDEFLCDCKGEAEWNRILWEITDPRFANSWIATREFRERVRVLRDIGYYHKGLAYYRDHTHESMWKVDEAIAKMIADEASRGVGKASDAEYFYHYSSERRVIVEPFDDHDVDLGRWDARQQLLYRRVSRDETERLLRIYKLRKQYVKEIESRLVIGQENGHRFVRHVRRGTYRKVGSLSVKGFLISKMGWINFNKEVAPEFANSKTRKLKVRITGNAPLDASKAPYEPVSTFLVYKNINSIVPGNRVTGQYSTFLKVPIGTEGWVIAVGYRNSTPYIGISPLPKDEKEVQLTVDRVTIDEYMTQLSSIN